MVHGSRYTSRSAVNAVDEGDEQEYEEQVSGNEELGDLS